MQHQNRQLAAILFTDIIGYTAMMQQDESRAVAVTRRYITVLTQSVETHHGQVLNDYGDGSLCTFPSVTDALHCAIAIQKQFQQEPKVPLRIGLHSGEVFFEGNKVMGDSVNIASRIQSLGQQNSILFSKEIFDKIRNQPELKSVSLGRFEFKNVDEPMEIFALANDGLLVPAKEQMSGKLKEIEKKSLRQQLIIITGAIIILIAAFFAYNNFLKKKPFSASEKSIAVLPFENTGANDSDLYISDGISQDVINNLSKIASFQKVIAWFSVKSLKKTTKTVKQIADELGVNIILTGTIQRTADNIQVIAELIDVNSNERLWGNKYNYKQADILSIQTEVSQQIVNALSANLSAEEKKNLHKNYTENVEAYKLYRRGRTFWYQRSKASFDSAELYYKKAIDIDPDYALAYAGLADCYTYNQKGLSQLEAVPLGRDYALKALSLDGDLSEALTTLGWIQGAFDYDWQKSKATLEKAIKLNPNYPLAHVYYGNVLEYTAQDIKRGISETKKALELDPLSPTINYVLGKNYYLAKQYELAYAQLKKTMVIDPKYYLTKGALIFVLVQLKKFSEALDLSNQLDPKNQYDYPGTYLSYTYAAMGDTIRAKNELMKLMRDFPEKSPYHFARCNVAIKNYSLALDELEQAYQQKDIRIYNYLKLDPILDPIRNEPRFKALLKKTNLE